MIETLCNSVNTPIENLNLEECPDEILEQFYDCINNIPYIKDLISNKRPRAKDLPRDEEGKVIIDITKPHILEDTDYFRPSVIKFLLTGKYTDLRPNKNPNSDFYKWASEEVRRCFEGYVRESDGEWITGDMYFFLNYCPMQVLKKDAKGKNIRTIDFPSFWEGHYYKTHYLNLCRLEGKHAMELASRGKGKSYLGAAMLAKRFIFGESKEVMEKVLCVVTASERKYIQGANLILDMFLYYIDFNALHCPWPHSRITDSIQNLLWTMGFKDRSGVRRGSLNSVTGITSKDDESKLRGSRGVLYLLEEAGSFPRLLNLYLVIRPSVEDGDATWGLIFGYGTSGDNQSDFSSMQELMYNPKGYKIKGVENIYDKEGLGRKLFTYFFPGYINRADCYDSNGNSDVTKALLLILKDRYTVKYNSTDINAITKRIAEIPITPLEAILRTRGNVFPVTMLNERLNQLDNNPNEYDDVYCGDLVLESGGKVKFIPTNDVPIREFPLKDNTAKGCVEIFNMPEIGPDGKVNPLRYIASLDPVALDLADSMSLGSILVLDLFTDKIVAEYTGRTTYSDDLYEKARLFCLFYNCKVCVETNTKGSFAYFSRMNSTHLLADTPEYLREKLLIKYSSFGSSSKGISINHLLINYGNLLIKEWLIKPVNTIVEEDKEEKEITVPNLFFIRNRALLKELILYNPDINVDRQRSLILLMLYREEKMVIFQGDISKATKSYDSSYAGNDDFFNNNYP